MYEDLSAYRVEESPEKGRIAVSTKDLGAGTVIVSERALGWAPDEELMQKGMCCICLSLLPFHDAGALVRCPSHCGSRWCSSCGDDEELMSSHRLECSGLAAARETNAALQAPLRDLMLVISVLRRRAADREGHRAFDRLRQLQDHADDYRKQYAEAYDQQRQTFAFMSELLKQKKSPLLCDGDIDIETMMLIWCVANVNSFSIGKDVSRGIAIFLEASMFSHSCINNVVDDCRFGVESKASQPIGGAAPQMIMRTSTDVQAGGELCINYMPPSQTAACSLKRRLYLHRTKFFLCQCPRCQDFTELGGLSSGMKGCSGCKDGVLVPSPDSVASNVLSSKPADGYFSILRRVDWRCARCQSSCDSESSAKLADSEQEAALDLNAIAEVADPKSDTLVEAERVKWAQVLHGVIQKHEKVLHSNHHLLVKMRMLILALLMGPNASSANPPAGGEVGLKVCIRMALELVAVYKTILPPYHMLWLEHYQRLEKLFRVKGVIAAAEQNAREVENQRQVLTG